MTTVLLNRRILITAIAFICVSQAASHAQDGKTPMSYPVNMNPPEVAKLVSEKKLILIDIRTPEEWAETGTAEDANRLDMNDPRFLAKLSQLTGNKRNQPIALICRTANRTRVVQSYLLQNGHSNVINVEGGMVGNRDDKGWIAHGLKINKTQ